MIERIQKTLMFLESIHIKNITDLLIESRCLKSEAHDINIQNRLITNK